MSKCVLVVEDDGATRTSMAELLRDDGYEVPPPATAPRGSMCSGAGARMRSSWKS